MIAEQVERKIASIARANGTRVEVVFEGSVEASAEITLANKISIVLESASPKPWEVYLETDPGDWQAVGSFENPDKLYFGLNKKLMDMAVGNVSTLGFDEKMSFANTSEMEPH